MKDRKEKKLTFVTAAQTGFLTTAFFISNNLVSYASACAFGFLFSFIPVAIMICTILVRILHTSPAVLYSLINFDETLRNIFSIRSVINSISSAGKIGSFEIIIGLSIFWMARRFFASVMDGMHRIFHRVARARPVLSQILVFGGEVLLVILVATVIFALISAKTLFAMPLLYKLRSAFPVVFGTVSQKLLNTMPYFLAMLFVTVTYRTASQTKPPFLLCLAAAACCMIAFWIAVRFMDIFLDKNKYDFVYGVFSHLIVILLEVFVFFILFLLFAEFIYIIQFFDLMLLGELYLLPGKEEKNIFSVFRRKLFIRPDYLLHREMNTIRCSPGTVIFKKQDSDTDVYYIAHGKVRLNRADSSTSYGRGCFFGELSCILNKERGADAYAETNSLIVKISGEKFRQLLEQDPRVAAKALSQISDYFTQIYGRTGSFLV